MTQRLDYSAIALAGVKALAGVYGYIVQSGLPSLLVNLVYLRISQINGCAYCIDMHSRALVKEGLPVEKLVLVQVWREAGSLFDARERSALSWPKPSLASPTPPYRTRTSRPLRRCSPRRISRI
jgi:AhpD family alkylhydroperoxidase